MRTSATSASERDEEALRSAQRAHEPSMEEILASIRTIIAEERLPAKGSDNKASEQRPPEQKALEQKAPEPRGPAAAPAAAPVPPQIVYSKGEPARPAAAAGRAEPDPDPKTARAAPRPERNAPVVPPAAVDADDVLLSPEAGQAVASAFDALSANLARRATEVAEGVAREMLRPMLKAWLDDNLPAIVERLVQAEIERLNKAAL